MPKPPPISGREAVRVFEKAGWTVARQRGSHVVLTKPGSIYTLSIPLHDVLGPGLLRDQIRKAGLTIDEFMLAVRKAPFEIGPKGLRREVPPAGTGTDCNPALLRPRRGDARPSAH